MRERIRVGEALLRDARAKDVVEERLPSRRLGEVSAHDPANRREIVNFGPEYTGLE